MKTRQIIQSLLLVTSIAFVSGCAVTRGQETVGAYVDDTVITSTIKTRFVESQQVAAAAISVETLKGTVMLSGFATSQNEKNAAENIARNVTGVRMVRNEIAVRP